MKRVLTIAGSDSGGGAGIQADLKTFMAFSVYGMSAITAVTAQNTRGVQRIYPMPPEMVAEQIRSVVNDIGVDAIKIGMLFSSAIIEAVATELKHMSVSVPIVIDPVMRAKNGDALLQPLAEETFVTQLLPLATVVTPNLPEASALLGHAVNSRESMLDAAKLLASRGPAAVLIKGGHLEGNLAADLLWTNGYYDWLEFPKILTPHTHGTGCTLSSAIAAQLARGQDLRQAVRGAKRYVTEAIRQAPELGGGSGPLNHHWGQTSWI